MNSKKKKESTSDKKEKKQLRLDPLIKRKQRNPKAFAINAPVATDRRARRKQDLQEKRFHVPVADRTPLEPPPVVVAVVGSPQVGKSTLIKSLVKYFTKHGLSTSTGPVTMVSGKRRRITLIECSNDIHCMIDVAKVADLVLLMVDASFGFEMELFEFLNICQSHGFPKIMAILTHLDEIKSQAEVKKVKKNMKKRFWTEIYKGAKLFFVYGVQHGLYNKRDTQKIARQVTVMKFRPLSWQTSHPYVLVDRLEDLTDPEQIRRERECERRISLYGYVRGTPLIPGQDVHIIGCGDFRLKNISSMPDPCPIPKRVEGQKKSLSEKERMIYAPFCGVGGVLFDKDAVYIDIAGSHSFADRIATQESDQIVNKMLESTQTINDKMRRSEFKFFKDEVPMSDDKFIYDDDDDDDDGDVSEANSDEHLDNYTKSRQKSVSRNLLPICSHQPEKLFTNKPMNEPGSKQKTSIIPKHLEAFGDDEDEGLDELDDEELAELASIEGDKDDDDSINGNDEDEEMDFEDELVDKSDLKWKRNLNEKAEMNFYRRQNEHRDIQRYVYGGFSGYTNIHAGLSTTLDQDPDSKVMQATENSIECTKEAPTSGLHDGQNYEKLLDAIKDKFVTGKWDKDKNAFQMLDGSDAEDEEFVDENGEDFGDLDDDEEAFDDFEDLEEGKKFSQLDQRTNSVTSNDNSRNHVKDANRTFDIIKMDDTGQDDAGADAEAKEARERMLKKMRQKGEFDAQYDDGQFELEEKTFFETQKEKLQQQANINRSVFENLDEEVRLQVEGFRAGLYVRIELDRVPSKLIETFDPNYPLIVGGLNAGEVGDGYVRVRLKKHRWFKKILKTRDPLIISMGWRRFQTLPIYHVMDDNMRNRALKYTPWHLHCLATFWGPLAPQGTGFVALQQADQFTNDFRIAATGVVLELNKSADIVKKLKLVGTPMEVFTKTAFIKGMFNSSLEVAKFENTPIRTVSGIRGLIKKSIRTPEGAFRATFEDKILMSDIVFLRTWYQVDVPKFCLTIKTLLLAAEERDKWRGARTIGQIRFESGLKSVANSTNPDSIYKPMARKQFNFRPFTVPKQLQKELPYKVKPKFTPKQEDKIKRVSAIKTDEEKRRIEALIMMGSLQKERQLKLTEKRLINKEKKEKMLKTLQKKKSLKHKK